MEISQVEAFLRVVRDGSFTRAAESLNLTQPAVSMRITALEQELGDALFERRGRTLSLTALGERFLAHAERLMAVVADSKQDIEYFQQGNRGQVRIAAPTPFLLSFLVETLGYFRDQRPAVDVLIKERNKTTIFELINDNLMTLGLVNAPVFDRRYVQLARFQDPIRAVVADGHPLADRQRQGMTIHMQDLNDFTVFRVSMFPQMTAFIDELVENARSGSGGAVIAIPMVMARRLILSGAVVTFLPESYIKAEVDAGRLVPLSLVDMPPLVSQPVLIAHRERDLDDNHKEFARLLKAQLRDFQVE